MIYADGNIHANHSLSLVMKMIKGGHAVYIVDDGIILMACGWKNGQFTVAEVTPENSPHIYKTLAREYLIAQRAKGQSI